MTKLAIEVEVPEGATHYTGFLPDDATFWKQKQVAGHPQWLFHHTKRNEWMMQGDNAPHFLNEVPYL